MKYKQEKILLTNVVEGLKRGPGQLVNFDEPCAVLVRDYVRKNLTRSGRGDNIVMSLISPFCLYVVMREKSYTEKLEDMLRKFMMKTEDEKLYDEAMKLLEDK